MNYSVVWFKRDLRLHDHAPLWHAAKQGPVLCLYVVETGMWQQPDAALQHYQFILEGLRELKADLKKLGGQLHILQGEVTQVLSAVHAASPFHALFSHEETGNAATYLRDQAVTRWCRQQKVQWQEFAQFGVMRGLKNRDIWQAGWEAHNHAPSLPEPVEGELSFAQLDRSLLAPSLLGAPHPHALGLAMNAPSQRQFGGRRAGLDVLSSFLTERSRQYRGGISSPLLSPTACSRISPYLAYGNLSLREVVQATRWKLAALPPEDTRIKRGLTAFISRLYWHCHFIQKLESEPALEWRNLHPGYDGLRESDWNTEHFEALIQGRTGWPMVDACVMMLRETGWINFRMRAMLVSVAAYPLWLHWQPVGHWLARQFLDYEPGIHWSQMQMQSGTTGINTTRVYNPIKQARDHDPHGHFVRRWLPALRRVPESWLFEPWRMPPDLQARYGVRVGTDPNADIPMPLVDLDSATREAKARLHDRRAEPSVKAAKAAIVKKHGSRRINSKQPRQPNTRKDSNAQLPLDF